MTSFIEQMAKLSNEHEHEDEDEDEETETKGIRAYEESYREILFGY